LLPPICPHILLLGHSSLKDRNNKEKSTFIKKPIRTEQLKDGVLDVLRKAYLEKITKTDPHSHPQLPSSSSSSSWAGSSHFELNNSDYLYSLLQLGGPFPQSNQNHNPNAKSEDDQYHRSSRYPLKILIAEDNLVSQQVLSKTLKNLGYNNISLVANGQEVLNQLSRSSCDVVLMDVMVNTAREGGGGGNYCPLF
jgi:DNA-binding NtrC family response regulator